MKKEDLKDIYPLTPLQEGMLFHALFDDDQSTYVEQFSYLISGSFSPDLFLKSWQDLVDRHDILRTAFEYERTKQPCQIVLKQVRADTRFIDLSNLKKDEQETTLDQLRKENREKPFTPHAGQLARLCIVKLDAQHHEIIRTHHHILLDGWSSAILLQELMEIYSAKVRGEQPNLTAPVSSKPYFNWLNQRNKQDSLDFWTKYLDGATATHLPFQRDKDGYTPAKHLLQLSEETTGALQTLTQKLRVTPAILCRAIWGLMLSRYKGKDDILFASVVTVRPHNVPHVEHMVGLFINTIPVRIKITEDMRFCDLLSQLQDEALKTDPHNDLALNDILTDAQKPDHLFAFENFHIDEDFQENMEKDAYGLTVERLIRHEHTHYDFTLAFNPGTRLSAEFSYNANRFSAAQIQRMAGHFEHILHQIIAAPTRTVGEIDILGPQEREIVLKSFNHNQPQTSPFPLSVIERFKQQVELAPNAPAVVDGQTRLTYRELDQRSDALAHHLQTNFAISSNQHVGVLLERSASLVCSFFGILKAGGVYVPLDPDTPQARIAYILKDSEAICVLSNTQNLKKITTTTPVCNLDQEWDQRIDDFTPVQTNGLAYMTYTSGSTGQPKGVMVEEVGLLNLVNWHEQAFDLSSGSRATLYASPAFDASLWEIVPNLLNGLCLYTVPDPIRLDVAQLIIFLHENDISHTFLPPAICEDVSKIHAGKLTNKIKILTGGDVLKDIGAGDLNIYNNYGPTECSVVATSTHITPDAPITIGHPIDNVQVYLLDQTLRPVPIGIEGEIYLGGSSLARGYWKQDDLTREKFISHPFQPGARLYKTGDIAHWDEQGDLHFIGRNDDQVQVRGYRVELGEIENKLESHPDIDRAIVIVDDHSHLVGFYLSTIQTNEADLKSALARLVPSYMIPQRLIQLDKLPLSERGKVDRKALAQQSRKHTITQIYHAPTSETEITLQEIWQEILEKDPIGIDDNFFDIGGHSLSATRIMSRIRNKIALELPFHSLFDNPTIARLAHVIEDLKQQETSAPIRPTITRSKRRQAAQ
ncbi:MAG: non-ribosomal peptide synthetase [Terasakiella sp.]|uniref:non-ribosomal peptide synthetase n=1 Tax=unclassified Terasakiella TaxID=2614952 RepID=UPI003AFF7C55